MSIQTTSSRVSFIVASSAAGALAVMVLLLAGAPLYTDDLWWHLKAGEMYASEGPWPAQDWMLFAARAQAPIQHEWLFGLALHAIQRTTGFYGLRVVHAVLVAGILWLAWRLFARAAAPSALAGAAWCAFTVLCAARLPQLRPDLISILTTLYVYRLLLVPARPIEWRHVVAFVAVVALWANAHSLFLIGTNLVIAALLGVALRALILRLIRSRSGPAASPAPVAVRLSVALAGALLFAAINPRGFDQHLAFSSATDASAIWFITDEWSHFKPFEPAGNHPTVDVGIWLIMNSVIVAFVITALARVLRLLRQPEEARVDAFDAIGFGLGCAGIVAALISIRFFWLAFLPMLYVLRRPPVDPRPARWRGLGRDWGAGLGCVVLAGWFSLHHEMSNLANRFGARPHEYLAMSYRSHKYHAEGVQLLASAGLSGRIYNPYWMGGFIGYWLSPDLRVFVDGRTEHYDEQVYLDYSAIRQMLGGAEDETFLDVLERRGIDVFFGAGFAQWWHPHNTTMHLERVPGWLLVSRSYRHAIYLRANERNRDNLARVASYYQREDVPFDVERGLSPDRVIAARPGWAMDHAMLPGYYQELLHAWRQGSGDERLRAGNRLGLVYLLAGAYRAQIEIDRQLLAIRAGQEAPRRRLVYGLLKLDRPEEALAVGASFLSSDPEDAAGRWSMRLARQYRELRRRPPGDLGPADRQGILNKLLWRHFPATASDIWPLEYAMRTEGFELRPKRAAAP